MVGEEICDAASQTQRTRTERLACQLYYCSTVVMGKGTAEQTCQEDATGC